MGLYLGELVIRGLSANEFLGAYFQEAEFYGIAFCVGLQNLWLCILFNVLT